MKIAMLFPYAPAYRESIYRKIDESFDAEWFFCGNAQRPLKLWDYSILKNTHSDSSEVTIKGNVRYIKNFNPSLFEKFDVVIFPGNIRNLSYWKLLFFNKWRHRRPKMIMWTHGWYGRESHLQSVIKRYFLSKADYILLYGEYAKHLMEQQKFHSSKLIVIANSLDYDKQLALRQQMRISDIYKKQFGNNNHTVIFIGRLTFEKRLDMLLDAIKALRNVSLNLNAVFIGDGEAKEELIMHAEELRIDESVWFYGACYDEKSNAELIYNADLCVSPGNVGLTAIHAMMFGTPVITHNNFPYQGPEFEAIKVGITGDFFNMGSVKSLAGAINNWFSVNNYSRDDIRSNCFKEIDEKWNPYAQLSTLKSILK